MVRLAVCPRCNHEYTAFPALSRIDNRTQICPTCGRIEALWEYYTRHAQKPSLSGFTDFLTLVLPVAKPLTEAIGKEQERAG
jgi:hypothetical protein